MITYRYSDFIALYKCRAAAFLKRHADFYVCFAIFIYIFGAGVIGIQNTGGTVFVPAPTQDIGGSICTPYPTAISVIIYIEITYRSVRQTKCHTHRVADTPVYCFSAVRNNHRHK